MSDVKLKKERSPAYPFIPLDTAIQRLVSFEKVFGRHPAPAIKAGLAWDMKAKSSQAFQTLAALKSFGLLEYSGSGDDRVATLTDDARTYLRAQQESVRQEVLRACAMRPKALSQYWALWGADRPPTPVCLDQLVLRGGFTESAAETFLKVYDRTIAYAGLSNSDSMDEHEEPPSAVAVGDFVQWESQGILQFKEAKKVLRILEDDGYLYVEGSNTAIPIDEVEVVEPPRNEPPQGGKTGQTGGGSNASNLKPPGVGMRQETFVLDSGEIVIQWPTEISAESFEDFSDWLDILKRKIKRSVKAPPNDQQEAEE